MAEQDDERVSGPSWNDDIGNLTEEEILNRLIAEEEDGEEFENYDQLMVPEQLVLPFLLPPSEPYLPRDHDRAIREASLAPGTSWKERAGLLSFLATNNIEVSFGSPDLPLDIAAARREISKLGERTVIVGRILLLLHALRYKRMATRRKGSSVPVLLSEILRLMGHRKHTKARQHGSSLQYTDGYRPEEKRKIIQEAALLSAFQVSAQIMEEGVPTPLNILGSYIKCSLITKKIGGQHYVVGFYVEPGDWSKAYEEFPEHPADNALARMNAAICQLDPQNDKHALRIALALVEHWQDLVMEHQAALLRGEVAIIDWSAPQKMSDLLAESMIPVPSEHVKDRFIPRVERALKTLTDPPKKDQDPDDDPTVRTILGSAQPTDEVARHQEHWEQAWLDIPWVLLPPADLINACTIVEESSQRGKKTRRLPAKKREKSG